MDPQTANILVRATNDFYKAQCESFSQTRQKPWDGWNELLPYVKEAVGSKSEAEKPFNVLDIGCGNMRFEEFLAKELRDTRIAAYAIDSCKPLADLGSDAFKELFQQLDIMEELANGTLMESLAAACPECDLSVAFGFMHHIPLSEWRSELMSALVHMTKPGGYICVSFWQPRNSVKLLGKLNDVTSRGCEALGIDLSSASGDYLLDWQEEKSVFRYVHDFRDEEIDALTSEACKVGTTLVKKYCADGKTGNLNRYIILQRNID